ncbi:hypothetical protein OG453_32470 [Streptomyces sp. NBC_01381]|uniref:hypothetical protein n=1 Tax=Streptomyces sp. NBC_01381 TaxID=2903845 RepID=UPI00225BA6CE|nr:hypothetical protein [Streptomyces sp. NBC_01381]MCX4671345.1 hypothetical protein [Streptomyces sp. NBC_01381]
MAYETRSGHPKPMRSRPVRGGEPSAPPPVHTAFALWITAVAAGVFEMVLAVGGLIADGDTTAGEIAGGLVVRMTVFSAAVLLAVQLRRGRNWARWVLAVGLGGFGTASLVVGPVQWLADGHAPLDAFRDLGVVDALFGASRVLHLSAVLGALVLMFVPAANAWFKASSGARPKRLSGTR